VQGVYAPAQHGPVVKESSAQPQLCTRHAPAVHTQLRQPVVLHTDAARTPQGGTPNRIAAHVMGVCHQHTPTVQSRLRDAVLPKGPSEEQQLIVQRAECQRAATTHTTSRVTACCCQEGTKTVNQAIARAMRAGVRLAGSIIHTCTTAGASGGLCACTNSSQLTDVQVPSMPHHRIRQSQGRVQTTHVRTHAFRTAQAVPNTAHAQPERCLAPTPPTHHPHVPTPLPGSPAKAAPLNTPPSSASIAAPTGPLAHVSTPPAPDHTRALPSHLPMMQAAANAGTCSRSPAHSPHWPTHIACGVSHLAEPPGPQLETCSLVYARAHHAM
jgi:hypothetical protein